LRVRIDHAQARGGGLRAAEVRAEPSDARSYVAWGACEEMHVTPGDTAYPQLQIARPDGRKRSSLFASGPIPAALSECEPRPVCPGKSLWPSTQAAGKHFAPISRYSSDGAEPAEARIEDLSPCRKKPQRLRRSLPFPSIRRSLRRTSRLNELTPLRIPARGGPLVFQRTQSLSHVTELAQRGVGLVRRARPLTLFLSRAPVTAAPVQDAEQNRDD
jgi:hypothetical protein